MSSWLPYVHTLLDEATRDSVTCTMLLMLAVFVVVFVASHCNDNYSWVDRTWSIVPVVYAWIQWYYSYTAAAGAPLWSTAFLFCVILTVWGVRLTFNFWRRGGYARGGEDYRWLFVRTWPLLSTCPLLWTLFNFFVISLFQTWLLWAITLPVSRLPVTGVTFRDALYAAAALVLICFETLFDNAQWRYQCAKRAPGKKDKELTYGFCVTGLFGYSRHLNVFCEGALWIVLSLAAYSQPVSSFPPYMWLGCVVLELLTLFSTGIITEHLTKQKYPRYAIYQRTTPMLIPSLSSSTARTILLMDLLEGEQE
ncbi:hypothetical protein AGDE_00322 [Angomonas deanei]|nr:hypothetical protein AGDE_00322 [Angomonas deanei]|eukprot:EPY43599.1 hypothetical protein AGDE_00322 [Angomonas deanei]